MTEKTDIRRVDPFASIALGLAIILMIWPLEYDLLIALAHSKNTFGLYLLTLSCFVAVALPSALSFRRLTTQTEKYKGRGYLYAAVAILALNIFFVGSALLNYSRQT